VSIGSLQTETDLRAFIQREIDQSALSNFVRQAQGSIATGLLGLAVTGTARKIAYGLVVVNAGAIVTVTHGLTDIQGNSVVPQSVVATANQGAAANVTVVITATTTTTFNIANTSVTNSNVFWIAVG
jgi:hypothetical protein